jgi:hypothetical protein
MKKLLLKEIVKKTKRVPFSKDDTNFFGKYLMVVDKLEVAAMRPDCSIVILNYSSS